MRIPANDQPAACQLSDHSYVPLGKLLDWVNRDQFKNRKLMTGKPRHTLPPHVLLTKPRCPARAIGDHKMKGAPGPAVRQRPHYPAWSVHAFDSSTLASTAINLSSRRPT